MGLSTGNSLASAASGGGSSGLSSSQVTTLIKSNTPYQHIATLTASTSSSLEYTSLSTDFRTFRIIYDGLTGNQNQYVRMQFYLDGALDTTGNYRYSGIERTATSANRYNTTSSYFGIIYNYEWGGGYPLIGFTEFTGNEANFRTNMYSSTAWQQGSNIRQSQINGHYNGALNSLITGFKLYPSSGTWSRGSIKIYGMNKNES